MSNIYEKMKELGIKLPEAPAKGGIYSPAKRFDKNLVYISGCGPVIDKPVTGVLGKDFTKEEGLEISRNSMLNVLSVLESEIGDLNKVKQPVKILTFVASDNSFYEQPFVANGGSQLLVDLFGIEKAPSRSAIGINVLPGNIPVETEAIFELTEE
ncbi:RidA family protein [Blautia liquoris]|uniref:RidA family protein n=1 Tax=Blautia liquoris TaxID=2779518 RepID=A0A7M2REH2_9FIRM|nr:RidA family protein [Blautia liquoris]QOV18716.1 RidA family protein [Blautia liquoris]